MKSERSLISDTTLIIIVLLVGAAYFLLRNCSSAENDVINNIEEKLNKWFGDDSDTLKFQGYTIEVLKIEGKSEVYLCSAEMQDYAIEKQTETSKFVGIQVSSAERQLMVIERQNCHYVLPLDSVQYIKADNERTIYVTLPELKYEASNTGEKVIIDNENFWRKFDHTPVANRAKKQIEHQFCTPSNLRTAQTNASIIIKKLVSELVDNEYKVEVVNDLNMYLESKSKD